MIVQVVHEENLSPPCTVIKERRVSHLCWHGGQADRWRLMEPFRKGSLAPFGGWVTFQDQTLLICCVCFRWSVFESFERAK